MHTFRVQIRKKKVPPNENLEQLLADTDVAQLENAVAEDFTDEDLERSRNKTKIGRHRTKISICVRWICFIIGVSVALAFVLLGFKYLHSIYNDDVKLDAFVRNSVSVILIAAATMFVDRNFLNKD